MNKDVLNFIEGKIMSLKIVKFPSYLSPSSLNMFENQPAKFYLLRQAPDPIDWEPQGLNAAIGSAFDYYFKSELLKTHLSHLKDNVKATLLNSMYDKREKERLKTLSVSRILWETSVTKKYRTEGMHRKVKDLFNIYSETDLFFETNWVGTEIHKRSFAGSVPLFMKLDNAISIDGVVVPHDIKYSRMNLKPGYLNRWDIQNLGNGSYNVIERGSHKNYKVDDALSTFGIAWATQLCTYGWGIGTSNPLKPEPFMSEIHMLSESESGIKIGLYRNIIDIDLQKSVIDRYEYAWDSIKNGKYLQNLLNDRFCTYLMSLNENWW